MDLNYYQAETATQSSSQSSPSLPPRRLTFPRFRRLSVGVRRCSFSLLTSALHGGEVERRVRAGVDGEARGERRREERRRAPRRSLLTEGAQPRSRAAPSPRTPNSPLCGSGMCLSAHLRLLSHKLRSVPVMVQPGERGGERDAAVITYIWLRTQEI